MASFFFYQYPVWTWWGIGWCVLFFRVSQLTTLEWKSINARIKPMRIQGGETFVMAVIVLTLAVAALVWPSVLLKALRVKSKVS